MSSKMMLNGTLLVVILGLLGLIAIQYPRPSQYSFDSNRVEMRRDLERQAIAADPSIRSAMELISQAPAKSPGTSSTNKATKPTSNDSATSSIPPP